MSQLPAAGQDVDEVTLWAAGALKFRARSVLPHCGHCGGSSARTSHSNSFPQSRHVYS
jgi:hypothetical protein